MICSYGYQPRVSRIMSASNRPQPEPYGFGIPGGSPISTRASSRVKRLDSMPRHGEVLAVGVVDLDPVLVGVIEARSRAPQPSGRMKPTHRCVLIYPRFRPADREGTTNLRLACVGASLVAPRLSRVPSSREPLRDCLLLVVGHRPDLRQLQAWEYHSRSRETT